VLYDTIAMRGRVAVCPRPSLQAHTCATRKHPTTSQPWRRMRSTLCGAAVFRLTGLFFFTRGGGRADVLMVMSPSPLCRILSMPC
jgi:hypothetical protein